MKRLLKIIISLLVTAAMFSSVIVVSVGIDIHTMKGRTSCIHFKFSVTVPVI